MMNEKKSVVTVAVVTNEETAERIRKEIDRQALMEELDALTDRIKEAGFKIRIVTNPKPSNTLFSSEIQIAQRVFANKMTNEYNMSIL